MGQRHQIFVHMANPIHHLNMSGADKKAMELEVGKRKTTVLAFHNQWLYGRSALASCLRVLQFTSQFTVEQKTTETGYPKIPFSPNHMAYGSRYQNVEDVAKDVAVIMNYQPKATEWLEAGFGGSWYIGKMDSGINFDFTRGDNNDGITIIDAINNKYCFMNIHDFTADKTELYYSASDLVPMQPYSAHDYVKCYYGETIDTCNPYYYEKCKTDKGRLQVVNGFAKTNNKLVKAFSKFEVLTLDEIAKMFPKMKLTATV